MIARMVALRDLSISLDILLDPLTACFSGSRSY